MAERIQCFAPIMDDRMQVLILGSLPGKMSLANGEYYANPMNQFWRLLGQALGISFLPQFSYENRLRLVQHLGIGIGSSIRSGERAGTSLDSSVRNVEATDPLYAIIKREVKFPKAFLFDGRLAERVFMENIHPHLGHYWQGALQFTYLPSSSAAYARMHFERKSRMWTKEIRRHLDYFSGKRGL